MRGGAGDYDWPRYQRVGDIAMPGAQDRWDQLTEPDARKQEAPQSHDPPRTADRPERGSLVDLRQRLERLPAGHPSSPYNDDLTRKPPVARLKDLELPLHGNESEGNGDAKHLGNEQAEGVPATERAETEIRNGSNGRNPAAEKVSAADWRSPPDRDSAPGWTGAPEPDSAPGLAPLPEPEAVPAWTPAPEPDSAPGLIPPSETDGAPALILAPESDSAPGLIPAPESDVAPEWAPASDAGAASGWTPAPGPDSPAGLIPEAEPDGPAGWTAAPESDGPAEPAPAPGPDPAPGWTSTFEPENSGEWRTAPDPEGTGEWRTVPGPDSADRASAAWPERAEPEPASDIVHLAPDLKPGPTGDEPRYGSDGSWEWNGRYLTPTQSQIADGALSRYITAEGRNVFGSYGQSGLTPAMRRIEARLERGQLLPDTESHALKTPDSFKESLADLISRHPDKPAEELSHEVHDAIRYAYIFENNDYADATLQVHSRLKSHGFELEARRNSWKNPEYKGINTRWRDPAHDLVFEVQFHTASSWDAKQRTQRSYRRITDPATPPAERVQLRAIQAKTSAMIPVPPGAASIPDYRREGK